MLFGARMAWAVGSWYAGWDTGNDVPGCGGAASPCKRISYVLGRPSFASGDRINVLASAVPMVDSFVLTRSVSIVGAGAATSTIDGAASRIVSVTTGISVTLQGLTLRNGATSSGGGAVWNGGTLIIDRAVIESSIANGSDVEDGGGGIYNTGTMTATNTTFRNNMAPNYSGGAIENKGRATISGSVFQNNRANYGGAIDNDHGGIVVLIGSVLQNNVGGAGGALENYSGVMTINETAVISNATDSFGGGGGIYNSSVLTLTNVTLSGNKVPSGPGAALYNETNTVTATASLTHVSIVGNTMTNTADADASAVYNDASSRLSMRASLLGANSPRNCKLAASGTATSLGNNISSDNQCAFLTQASDKQSTDPGLGVLSEVNGTWLHPLLRTSLALNAIDSANCASMIDQRGVARPQMGKCDIGAFEAIPIDLGITASTTPTSVYASSMLTGSALLTNTSGAVATGVVVTSALPLGTTFGACTVSQGSCVSGTGIVTATIGSLAGGATAALTVTLATQAAGPLSWRFNSSSNEPDSVPANDSATASATVLSSADLSVTITSPSEIKVSSALTYTLVVTNNGGSPAASPVVTLTLPISVTFIRAVGDNWQCTQVSGVITCIYQPTNMPIGVASPIEIVIVVSTTPITLQVTSSISSTTYDPVIANNNAYARATIDQHLVYMPIVTR